MTSYEVQKLEAIAPLTAEDWRMLGELATANREGLTEGHAMHFFKRVETVATAMGLICENAEFDEQRAQAIAKNSG